MPRAPFRCPYCSGQPKLVTGATIYPHRPNLADRNFWQCAPCDAYVGCHEAGTGFGDGTRPFGTLANAELRSARKHAHLYFDALWKDDTHRSRARTKAYAWLARELGISVENCHIASFDADRCRRVVDLCKAVLVA